MPCTQELVEELNTLLRFDLATSQQGIKIHKDADPAVIAAIHRLHAKGLVTQTDGGYLTAAEHPDHPSGTPTSLRSCSRSVARRRQWAEEQRRNRSLFV